MRIFASIATLVAVISIIFKWRFRIINTILAISFIRKIITPVIMKIPFARNKLLPQLFGKTE